MKLIRPECRSHLTSDDVDFVISVMARQSNEEVFLHSFLVEANARDSILDDNKLVNALQDSPGQLKISPFLYFYLLVRHWLLYEGLDDREMADYVAEMLSEFTSEKRLEHPVPGENMNTGCVADMLAAMGNADEQSRFLIQAHIGNYSLFMTGLYPEKIVHRMERHGAPGINYYEKVGISGFERASHLRLAAEYELAGLYERLSSDFHRIRTALNDMREKSMFVSDDAMDLGTILDRKLSA